jgi:glycosyltransferase involved in cell wall biosynthesis
MEKNKYSATPLLGIFNDCFPPVMDGVSMTAQNYAYWLARKTQNNVCVVTPKCPGAFDMPYPVYRYSSLFIPFRKPYRFGIPLTDIKFKRQMDRLPFGLVHAHCPFSSGKIAMQIAKKRGIPIVTTFHSKYKMDFARIIPNKYILRYIVQNIVDFYEMADEVWIPQAAVEETLREYGYKGKVEVVENGNDFADRQQPHTTREAAREELGIPTGQTMFLFVGQHIWEKNIAFLIRALTRIRDIRFHAYFIGTGYAEKKIKRMVEELSLSHCVTFVGQINSRALLMRYYAAADLFLFPSLYDNAPLVVREAAAMRTPSVLLSDSTAAEIIDDGQNGFLSADDIGEYSNLIRRLVRDPDRMQQVGCNAAQTLVRPWSNVMDEVLDRYVHLMNRR